MAAACEANTRSMFGTDIWYVQIYKQYSNLSINMANILINSVLPFTKILSVLGRLEQDYFAC